MASNIPPEYKIGNKVHVKGDKALNNFNGSSEIIEIFKNFALIRNFETNQESKINFNRLNHTMNKVLFINFAGYFQSLYLNILPLATQLAYIFRRIVK